MSPALALLALKLTLVPAIIYAVTLAGRRWGARVAGRLSAFPVVAGPILLFVAIEQSVEFAAAAGAGTVAAIAAFAAYALVYSWLATRFAWPPRRRRRTPRSVRLRRTAGSGRPRPERPTAGPPPAHPSAARPASPRR
ncbi:MAG: hypothetical protein H2060_07065 [Azoarcus sp.]|nr:hypothetical protein [Azoarcus sp.]